MGYDKINAMMNRLEEVPERIPTPEEVLGVMKQMANGEIRETKRLIDEEGKLYRLDAELLEKKRAIL